MKKLEEYTLGHDLIPSPVLTTSTSQIPLALLALYLLHLPNDPRLAINRSPIHRYRRPSMALDLLRLPRSAMREEHESTRIDAFEEDGPDEGDTGMCASCKRDEFRFWNESVGLCNSEPEAGLVERVREDGGREESH